MTVPTGLGSVAVHCVECGRTLGGRKVGSGIRVSKHKAFDTGSTCPGSARVDHVPVLRVTPQVSTAITHSAATVEVVEPSCASGPAAFGVPGQ